LYPFSLIGDAAQILFISTISSFIILFVFRKFSSSEKKKIAKNKIKANIFAIRIYKDFWFVIVKSFFKSLFYTLKYFLLNFGPVLIFFPLLFLFSIQMDIRFGMQPFKTGDEIILSTSLTKSPHEIKIELEESKYYKRKMPPVYISSFDEEGREINEINWKLVALKEGIANLSFKVDEKIIKKRLVIGNMDIALSNYKFSSGKFNFLYFLNPAEITITRDCPIKQICIRYPPARVKYLFLNTHWIILYIFFIFIIVLSLKNRFGIEF
jgi:hypothetical protein